MIYGQYTTAKGCVQVLRIALAIYISHPLGPYCFSKLCSECNLVQTTVKDMITVSAGTARYGDKLQIRPGRGKSDGSIHL